MITETNITMSTFAKSIATMITDLYQMAYNAHRNSTHWPERQAKDFVTYYNDQLAEDIEEILEKGKTEEVAMEYAQKYKSLITTWLARKSMCANWFITGRSNFPVAKNNKRLNAEHAAGETFQYWRGKALKRLLSEPKELKTNQTELERYRAEHKKLTDMQTFMKRINSLYPKFQKVYKLDAFIMVNKVTDFELKVLTAHVPDYQTKTKVFATYQLTNNNANIKRIEARIEELEAKELRAEKEMKVIAIPGGEIAINYTIDRITIYHPEKPERPVIDEIKAHGFNWSGSQKIWMRKITANSLYVVDKILIPRLNAL